MNYQEIREQICDVCHKMWQLGWVAANDGNVSVKLPDGNFLVTPTGISKSFITSEKLVIIDKDMNIVEAEGNYKPSSEIKMHMRCYTERDDVGAVVHAHPPTATGYAVAGKSLDEYSMIETVIAIGSIPLTPYGTPSTNEVPEAIAPYLAEHDVLLLQNHGALTVGCDLITAYYRMETLELFAKISLNAHLLGGAKEIPKEQIDKLLYLRDNYYHVTGRHDNVRKAGEKTEKNGIGRMTYADQGFGYVLRNERIPHRRRANRRFFFCGLLRQRSHRRRSLPHFIQNGRRIFL